MPAAMCIAAGNVSFDDCPMFTWSFGMDRAFLALRADAEAESMVRQVGDHLVGVHVGRGAGAGLIDVDRESARRACRRPLLRTRR